RDAAEVRRRRQRPDDVVRRRSAHRARALGSPSSPEGARAFSRASLLATTERRLVDWRLATGDDRDAPRSLPDLDLLRHGLRREIDHRYIVRRSVRGVCRLAVRQNHDAPWALTDLERRH